MHTFILAEPEKCIGCRACALACAFEHDEEFSLSLSRISPVWMEDLGRFVPMTCQQCGEAPCIEACPRQAISVDAKTGARVVDEARCIGCRACFLVCPFGIPALHRDKGVMIKCDLCGGKPQCVEECARKALTAVEADDAALERRRAAARKLAALTEKIT
jgi:anaerobic carbon-monoxide dehydrogenase iron sulfur subunit